MEYRKLVSPSLTDLFVREITRMILSGELSVGDKLASERELASKMNVSTTVVHSGIARLAQQGFLRVIPRVGVYVEDYAANGTVETMAALIDYSSERYIPKFIEPMTELVINFEPLLMKKVCEHRTLQQIHDLEEIIRQMKATTSPHRAAELAYDFHHGLAVASGNTAYPLIFSTMKKVLIATMQSSYETLSIPEHAQFFSEALEAIYVRDSEKAAERITASMTKRFHAVENEYKTGKPFSKD